MFILLHLAAVFALFVTPNATDLALLAFCYVLNGIGISVGYHRLISHGSFKCSPLMRGVFAALGASSLEGGPIDWAGIHRRHHQVPDVPGKDPHSPRDGFWHAHMGWIYHDFEATAKEHYHLAADLEADPYLRTLNREPFYLVPWLLLAAFCYAVGGVSSLLWAVLFRTILVWHLTWSINSICHVVGYQNYPIDDTSRNFWPMGLLGFGEGWHNNHHAHGTTAWYGHRWWELDPGLYVLLVLEKLGLVWDLVPGPWAQAEDAVPADSA